MEADCSIVMAEGDPATRQIANLVRLWILEFKTFLKFHLRDAVVNNIAHIAPIFLIKTVYSSFSLSVLPVLFLVRQSTLLVFLLFKFR